MITKSKLAITLSKLKVFDSAKVKLEQYPTDSEVAADVLWNAFMQGDIGNKIIADLGAGTGVLGIGALILGAKKVYFVEKDKDVIKLLKENLQDIDNYEIINSDISEFNKKVDVVIQNPPFGTKEKHADKLFLEKAFSISDVVYSFHKTVTKNFVRAVADDFNFKIKEEILFAFPLKAAMKYHKKRIERIEVSCFRLKKS